MKNSEICRVAMPFIFLGGSREWDSMSDASFLALSKGKKFNGMCDAIYFNTNAGNPEPILKILFCNVDEFYNTEIYYYPIFSDPTRTRMEREQGYTSRIIFLELAALLWEEKGN